jgi:hypothetical protein
VTFLLVIYRILTHKAVLEPHGSSPNHGTFIHDVDAEAGWASLKFGAAHIEWMGFSFFSNRAGYYLNKVII